MPQSRAQRASKRTSAADPLWECSSPDSTPTKGGPTADTTRSNQPLAHPTLDSLNRSDLYPAPKRTAALPSRHVAPEDLPDIQDAERMLDAGRSALQETLLQHEKEVMTREETLLAITREAKQYRQKIQTLESAVDALRREKEESAAKATREIESLCRLHRAEVEACQNARHSAEMQLQKLMIDFDETKQQLVIAKRQNRDLETQRDEMNAALAAFQRRLQQREADVENRNTNSQHEAQASRQKLDALRGKFDTLERLCDALRKEKDDMERQARQSLMELHELRSKKDHRVLVDVNEVHAKEQQVLRLEEQLQAAHLGNARLLRLMAECSELHDIIRFNEVTQDFVFVGYHALLPTAADGVDGNALLPPAGADDDEVRVRLACHEARGRRPATGGAFGIVGGASHGSKNAFLRDTPPLSGVPNAMRHLNDAIQDENRFLHQTGVHLSAAPVSPVAAPLPSNNLVECKSHEKYYWIPRAVLVEAQDFKEAYFPRLSLQVFFPFLVRINQIWRQREQHLVREAKRRASSSVRSTSASGRALAPSKGDRREDYERTTARRLEEDIIAKELESIRREVRLRVSSKTALQLCKQLESIARHQIAKRASVEMELEELAAIHQHTLADRAPQTVAMQSHLRTMSDTARSLSFHVSSKLGGASSDIRRFVSSLEAAAVRSSAMTDGVVSATVVRQLMACIKDFADEVKTESMVTTESLRRIADAAERAATDVPPVGYRLPTGRDDKHDVDAAGRAASAYDDLVDDVHR